MTNRALADAFCTSSVHLKQSWQQLALQLRTSGHGMWEKEGYE